MQHHRYEHAWQKIAFALIEQLMSATAIFQWSIAIDRFRA